MNEATKQLLRDLRYQVDFADSDDGECDWGCGYYARLGGGGEKFGGEPVLPNKLLLGEETEAWAACLAHAESEEGLRTNFHRVAALLGSFDFEQFPDGGWVIALKDNPHGKKLPADDDGGLRREPWAASRRSHEAAAFALLRKVMGA